MDRQTGYHPAPEDSEPFITSIRRKGLSQGRVTSQPFVSKDLMSMSPLTDSRRREKESLADYELPQGQDGFVSSRQHKSRTDVIDRISEAEKGLSNAAEVVERQDVIRHPTKQTGTDPTSSPRRDLPQQYKKSSHAAALRGVHEPQRDDRLALSEDDEKTQDDEEGGAVNLVRAKRTGKDLPRHVLASSGDVPGRQRTQHQAVLLVDVTGVPEGGQSGEVDVKTSIITSPVSVIRHAPHRSSSRGGQVKDEVLVDLSDLRREEADKKPQAFDEEDVLRPGSDMEDLGVAPLGEKTAQESSLASVSIGEKRRKGRIVPSRYMQKLKPATKPGILSTSTVSKRRSASKSDAPLSQTVLTSNSSHGPIWQSTPYEPRGLSSGGARPNVSAIRAADDLHLSLNPRLQLDDSLAPPKPPTKPQPVKRALKAKASGSFADSSLKAQSQKSSRHVPTQQQSGEMRQAQLDLAEARVFQWTYLEGMAKAAAEEQEKEAMRQIYSVWAESEKMRQNIYELESELLRVKYEEELDRTIDEQLAAIDPVISQISTLLPEYKKMARALDTTRHQMAVHGFHLPHNQDELLSALQGMEGHLGELSSVTRQQQPQVAQFSQTIQALENAVNSEEKDIETCRELLAACSGLQLQETSRIVQEVQKRKDTEKNSH
eukprot:m.41599 g.41599  ORF g.41599 m.41599 type:complete len:659 (+) comp33207_c1_seq10:118-2094(+)